MFVFSELVGWWASGLVRQWEWGLGAGDSGIGDSGTVRQWDSAGVGAGELWPMRGMWRIMMIGSINPVREVRFEKIGEE